MQQLSVNNLRFTLIITLIVLAPLSKYPFIGLPAYNFSSFRLGLYQLMATIFVLTCIVPVIKSLKQLFSQNKVAFMSILVLGLTVLLGLFGAYYKARSALLAVSIISLLAVLVCAWWYIRTYIKNTHISTIVNVILVTGIIYGIIGVAQFVYASVTASPVDLICKTCGSEVFGFPRINGFAAEPQFLANALIPFFFIALGAFYKLRTWLAAISLGLVSLVIGLTFSRGAFIAMVGALFTFVVVLFVTHQLRIKAMLISLVIAMIAIFGSFTMLVASASYQYRGTPNITYNTFRTMISQLSGGIITIPEKVVVVVAPANPNAIPAQPTTDNNAPTTIATVEQKVPIASDVIEESSQDRLAAAKLALRSWSSSIKTIIIGVGPGNLGPYTIAHIDPNVPNNLTVYIYYVLLLSELGLIGLASFIVLFATVLLALSKVYWQNNGSLLYIVPAVILTAFLIQYLFFGSYINVMYIWLWLGIGLGLASVPLKKGYN